MGKLCRKVPYGPGAEELVNRGRKYLNYVEGMPDFLGSPVLDEVYKTTLAGRTIVMANGSVIKTTRGPINRSEAFVPTLIPEEPLVAETGYFIGIDVYDINGNSKVGMVMFPLVFKEGQLESVTTADFKFYPASMAPGGVIQDPVIYSDRPPPNNPIITVSANEKYNEILGLFHESNSYVYNTAALLPNITTGGQIANREVRIFPTSFWTDLQNLGAAYVSAGYIPLWYEAGLRYDHSGYLIFNPMSSTPWSAASGFTIDPPSTAWAYGSGYSQSPNPQTKGGLSPAELFPPSAPPGLHTGIATLFFEGWIQSYYGPIATAGHGVYFGPPGGIWQNSYIYNIVAYSTFQAIGSVSGTGEEVRNRRNTTVKRPGGPSGIVLVGPLYSSRTTITEFSGYDIVQIADASPIFGYGSYVNCTAEFTDAGEEIEEVSDHGWVSEGRQGFIVQRTIGSQIKSGLADGSTRNSTYYSTYGTLKPGVERISSSLYATPIPVLSKSGSVELNIDIHYDNSVIPMAPGVDSLRNYGYDTMVNYYDFEGQSMFVYGFMMINHTESFSESHATSFELGVLFGGQHIRLFFTNFAGSSGLPVVYNHPQLGELTTWGEFRLLQLGEGI